MTDPFTFDEAEVIKAPCSDIHTRQEMVEVSYPIPTGERLGMVVENIEVMIEEAVHRIRYTFEHHFSGLSSHRKMEILAAAQREGGE